MKDGIIGFCGCAILSAIRDEVSAWVTLACSLAIAIVTCGVQVYRLIRDKDRDEGEKRKKKRDDEDEK